MPPESESTLISIQGHLDCLASPDESVQRQARRDLVQVAYARLLNRAELMLLGYPRLREEASDILHEALIKLERALDEAGIREKVRTPAKYLGFAQLQMRRTLIDLARRLAKAPVPLEEGHDEPESTWNPAKLVKWTLFHEAIKALPDDEAACFEHIWLMGLNNTETARVLGVNEGTVRRRLVRAQELIEEACGGVPWED